MHAGSDPHRIEDSLTERLARAIHEHYLTKQLEAGVALTSRRSMRPWGTLTEEVKAANRSQAADIGTKLGAIGCVLAPNPIWGQPERLGQSDIESLAVQEHRRWCGWMAEH